MKLLVISQYYWPENFRINEVTQTLSAKGVDVEILTGKPNYPGGIVFEGYRARGCVQEPVDGLQVNRVPLLPRGKGSARLALNYLSFVFSAAIFGPRLLRGKHFDAIFVYAPSPILQAIPAIWIGRLKKCAVLLWVQDLWPESLSATGHMTNRGLLNAVEYVVRWIYGHVDLLLVQSKAFIPKVRALAGTTPVVYHPNSFVDDVTLSVPPVVECPALDCAFPVLFAGNIGSAQAVEVVLEAATILRDVEGIRFVMIGDGSRRDWLLEQAAERGLSNLVFPGRYPFEAMPALMAKAGALLVTLADTEIFRLTIPSKIQAYLAAGRPIIACLNGVGAEIIAEAGAGLATPAEDASALADAVKALYKMPEGERLEMGARGRAYYEEHFSHDKLVDELIGYFEQAVRSHKGFTQ
ncbi:MAG: glycosyltransferase WbuB [Nitrosomonadaceae bacterium]|nr:glycosyltransferase WbuB [Nitrosomonadaceae bacterium]